MAKDLSSARLSELVNQKEVDDKTLTEVREMLRTDRQASWLLGTPSILYRQVLLKRIGYGSPVLQEAVLENMNRLEEEMGGRTATGAERLLIENVLMCWTWVQYAEGKLRGLALDSHSIAEGRYWQETADRAHGRFNRAVQSLANYRKVAINVQVNIAGQQINAQTVNATPKG